MYSKEEIREIIAEVIAEEVSLFDEKNCEKYYAIQSLKSRLYDAFGLEDDVL